MPRRPRHDDTSFDRLSLMRELADLVEREDSGQVTVSWWRSGGRRFVEVSKVASWTETTEETVLDQALELDRQYLAQRGRHISAERLARELRIGKERALSLVRDIRSGHIDVAK